MEYWWIPLATGLLAFLGSMGGHFLSFNLNSEMRRREVLRTQIEKFTEYISEDQTWMNEYRLEACFRSGKFPETTAPKDKAQAIFHLYFKQELSKEMVKLIEGRHKLVMAIDTAYGSRIDSAIKNKTTVALSMAPDELIKNVTTAHKDYYEALLDTIIAAGEIARRTIPTR